MGLLGIVLQKLHSCWKLKLGEIQCLSSQMKECEGNRHVEDVGEVSPELSGSL